MAPANPMFSTPEMAAIFSPDAHVGRMLEFEAALAQAEAAAGVIPAEAAQAIAAACRVERFDVPALYRAAVPAGTLAIPLVRALTEQVAPEGRDYVHWGATSQDVIDTAMVLQMRDGLSLLIARLLDVGDTCAALAEQHRRTLMPGRTLMQQALPITFGLKAARWLGMTTRQVARLDALRREVLVVQFGGAAGTLASLGADGTRVVELLAERLGLGVPDLPWHAERDRMAEIASALGVVAGAMAKIATDLVLLAQTEVGEVSEGAAPGKGGSSAMPQKRNPVDATFALAAARLAMGAVPVVLSGMAQEQERAVGGWQAEWEALPELFLSTASAVERVWQALSGLEVDAERMRGNLDMGGGLLLAESLTMALARRVGRPEAYRLVQAAVARVREEGTTLREAAMADEQIRAVVTEDEIDQALDPAGYLGSTDAFIDRALARYREVRATVQ